MTSAVEDIKREVTSLMVDGAAALEVLKEAGQVFKFGAKYQNWYSRAYKVVQALAPERLSEFSSYYLIDPKRKEVRYENYVIQDYIKNVAARTFNGKPLWDAEMAIMTRVMNQMQILKSLEVRIEGVLKDVSGYLFSELQDAELDAAKKLIKINVRAAGALAGVVLERHLQRVAISRAVAPTKKSPTISDLNDPLRNAGAYDVIVWRKIQFLADVRNVCSHQKDVDPTSDQVNELIEGVNYVIKNIS